MSITFKLSKSVAIITGSPIVFTFFDLPEQIKTVHTEFLEQAIEVLKGDELYSRMPTAKDLVLALKEEIAKRDLAHQAASGPKTAVLKAADADLSYIGMLDQLTNSLRQNRDLMGVVFGNLQFLFGRTPRDPGLTEEETFKFVKTNYPRFLSNDFKDFMKGVHAGQVSTSKGPLLVLKFENPQAKTLDERHYLTLKARMDLKYFDVSLWSESPVLEWIEAYGITSHPVGFWGPVDSFGNGQMSKACLAEALHTVMQKYW